MKFIRKGITYTLKKGKWTSSRFTVMTGVLDDILPNTHQTTKAAILEVFPDADFIESAGESVEDALGPERGLDT